MTHSEVACWLSLIYASGLKLARAKSIVINWCLEGGNPLAALFELPAERISAVLDLAAEEIEQVVLATRHLDGQAAWLAQLEGAGVQAIIRTDPRYPRALIRWLPPTLQPLVLFGRGNATLLSRPSAALIGSHDAGPQTVGLARELAALLAEEGLVILTGLGKGVSQAAFNGAISIPSGQSIAVLPMGINTFRITSDTAGEVTAAFEQGRTLWLSPFHPEAKFNETQALARNKLIVGLAEAVFVLAAGDEDPAREAADEALRLGKAVYVWDVDPVLEPAATGNQTLIQEGALPIAGLADTLEAVEAIVAATLELVEATDMVESALLPAVSQSSEEEAATARDPETVLGLLSETGRVPAVLARRLRKD